MPTKDEKKAKRQSAGEDEEKVDWWKEPDFKKEDSSGSFLEESDFRIMFPDHRLAYIQEVWHVVKKILGEKNLKVDLDLGEKTMSVATTAKTWDPFAIIKARDFLKLISRGVPVSQAKRIFEDDMFCDIIKIAGIVRNKERFARRRQRLVGPNGATLKVIELLTQCYVCISGQTVAAIGPWKGLKKVRKIVLDTMNNFHPVYSLKTLMIQKELEKDEALVESDWTHLVPHFKKNSNNKRVKKGGVGKTVKGKRTGDNEKNENAVKKDSTGKKTGKSSKRSDVAATA